MITSETSKIQQIDDLDAVRGIGILMVFFFHATGFLRYDIQFLPPLLKSFITAGRSGVTLFFVLSAFLLVQPYIKALGSEDLPSWKKFYMRRILRIIPMFFLMVVASALVLNDYKTSILALNIAWGVSGPELSPFSTAWWAVYSEIQFYILLPVIGFFIVHKKKSALIVCLLLYTALYFMTVNNCFSLSVKIYLQSLRSILGRGFIFVIGGGGAWIFIKKGESIKNWVLESPSVSKMGDVIMLLIFFLIGLLLWASGKVTIWKIEIEYSYYFILEAILWCGFMLGLLFVPFRLKPLISNGFFKNIGKISYSIYLLHYPILVYGYMAIEKLSSAAHLPVPSKGILIMIIFVLCTGASALTYRFIEKPFLERKQHFY